MTINLVQKTRSDYFCDFPVVPWTNFILYRRHVLEKKNSSSFLKNLLMFLISFSLCVHSRGGAIKFLGTKRHHDKWLSDTENYVIKGSFAMTELGHGSNVSGIILFLDSVTMLAVLMKCIFSSSID
jgi:hypothetical protein